MKIFRSKAEKTFKDKVRNNNIIATCTVDNILRWENKIKRDRRDDVLRINEDRIISIVRDEKRAGRSWAFTSQENYQN